MYKHILISTDGSKLSLKAAKAAASLARTLGAKLTAVYVMEPFMPRLQAEGAMVRGSFTSDQGAHRATCARTADAALREVKQAAAAEKVDCEGVSMTDSQPWEGILRTAKAKKCDVIVMASRGRGAIAGAILGSETQKVLANSKTPVLVCR